MRAIWALALLGAGTAATAQECAPEGDMEFVCGLNAVEDLIQVRDSSWLVGSGLGTPGRPGTLVLLDTADRQARVVYPSAESRVEHDSDRFESCPTPPDRNVFNAHGITLREHEGQLELLVVNHGGREAVEFFRLETGAGGAPQGVTWLGCVTMPEDTYMNSLDSLPDGGFVAKLFYRPSQGGIGAVFDREITGGLLEWRPGEGVTPIPDTEVSGANGILLSDGGGVIHIAAWGTRELVRFEREGETVRRAVTVPVDFAPDNLRWTADGNILVAGQKFTPRP